MSADISSINYPVLDHLEMKISVTKEHFLIRLAQEVSWEELADLSIADLYSQHRNIGRKLNLRHHIGAFILQSLFKWTDRELAENLNYYAPARVFCGLNEGSSFVHSTYVKFRNRITEETAKKFNISVIKVAAKRGFTGSHLIDYDSTVQEANIEYPSDARMMQKLIQKCEKVFNHLIKNGHEEAKVFKERFDFSRVKKVLRGYFLSSKNRKSLEKKRVHFSYFHSFSERVSRSLTGLYDYILDRPELRWNIRKDYQQIEEVAPILLRQIKCFIETGKVAKDKILSLYAKEVKCIAKGKVGKPYEFGRKWFIGRLEGNYTFGFTDKNIGLDDTISLEKGLKEFKNIFGKNPYSITGDRGFWSPENLKTCEGNIQEIGITPRRNLEWKVSSQKSVELATRRVKVEPIIGHLKKRGMEKSKMKTDDGTKLAGQRSILSLNLSKLARDLCGRKLKWSA